MNLLDLGQQNKTANYVLPETVAISVIGLLDLVSTIYLIAIGRAGEANPLLATILQNYGIPGFIGAKALLIGGPVVGLEWARKRSPQFVRLALRIGIVLYLALYIFGWLHLNAHFSVPDVAMPPSD